jgi:sugar lactone lactonase YvrE
MKKVRFGWFGGPVVVLSLVAAMLLEALPALAAPGFGDAGFENTWNRVDKPVQDLPGVGRGYTWGPPAPNAGNITTETYNGAARKVQYFDKARMEINNPGGNPADLFYVTTGLLVKELVTGNRQDGDSAFTALPPSQVQVAGDTNEGGANPLAPTYASFRFVGTFFGKENSGSRMSGQPITARIDRAGTVTSGAVPEQRLLKGYDEVTGHNIADVFEDYGNLSGPIWNGSAFVNGSVFFGLPLYVFGRPITEPYWVRTAVNGVVQDVLVQLFERRVLTYTPQNPDGFKVEMGNVGQHYYRWRYELNRLPAQSPTKAEFANIIGHDNAGLKNPGLIAVDSHDNFFISTLYQIYKYDSQGHFLGTIGDATPGSDPGKFDWIVGISFDANDNFYVAEAKNHRVQKFDPQGHLTASWDMPKRRADDDFYPRAMAVNPAGNVYLLDLTGVMVFDNRGFALTQWGTPGPADNQLNFPMGLGVDSRGNVYIMDSYNIANTSLRGTVKKFDAQGHYLLKWDTYDWPRALMVDRKDNVFLDLNKYDSNGKELDFLGTFLPPAQDAPHGFNIAFDQANNIFVAGNQSGLVTKLAETGERLTNFSLYGRGDGQLRNPTSLVVDGEGNLYVYDSYNLRIQKFDPGGRFLLKWGSDGTPDSRFSSLEVSLAVDDQGNIYAADPVINRILKFDGQGHQLLKIGQAEETSYCQGRLAGVQAITVDSYGYIYAANGVSTNNCIEKFDRTGKFVQQWGGNSQLDYPASLVADRQGHLYIADPSKNQIYVYDTFGRFIKSWATEDTKSPVGLYIPNMHLTLDTQGNVYTLNANNGQVTKYDSQGKLLYAWGSQGTGSGQFMNPQGIAIDSQGNVYVADSGNDRIEKFNQS